MEPKREEEADLLEAESQDGPHMTTEILCKLGILVDDDVADEAAASKTESPETSTGIHSGVKRKYSDTSTAGSEHEHELEPKPIEVKVEQKEPATGPKTAANTATGPTTTVIFCANKSAAFTASYPKVPMPSLHLDAYSQVSNATPGAIFIPGTATHNSPSSVDEVVGTIGVGVGVITAGIPQALETSPFQAESNLEEGNLGNLIEAELVMEGPLAVAEPAPTSPDRKFWYCLAGGLMIMTIAIVVSITLTSKNDNRRNTATPMPIVANNNTDIDTESSSSTTLSYTESLQWGNTIIGSAPFDRFGAPMALSSDGTILAVGARNNGNAGKESGLVRVFHSQTVDNDNQFRSDYDTADTTAKSRVIWAQHGNAIGGEAQGDHFAYSGMAMSSDGGRIAVGATYYNVSILTTGEVVPAAGNIRIFDLVSSSWVQVGSSIDGLGADDQFGRSVSINSEGNIVASGSGQSSSYVRVFREHSTVFSNTSDSVIKEAYWKPMGSTLGGEDAPDDRFGRSLDLSASGLRIAVGATQNKKGAVGSGYVRIYDYNGTEWNQVGQDIVGDYDQDGFGRDVSLNADGSIVACGAQDADENGESSGRVRIYRLIVDDLGTAAWEEIGEILGAAESDEMGGTLMLSASGSRLAVGASQRDRDGGTGYVQIFDYNNSANAWNKNGPNLEGVAEGDRFGAEVQMSSNGLVLAVGAIASDTNGDDSGDVHVFNLGDLVV